MTSSEPHSPARERRILAFLMLDGAEAMTLCAERGLAAEHFYGAPERTIFEECCQLHQSGQLFAEAIIESICVKKELMPVYEFAEVTKQIPPYGMACMEIPKLVAEMKRLYSSRCILKASSEIPLAVKDGDPVALQKAIAAITEAPTSVLPRATWKQTGAVEIARYQDIAAGKLDPDVRSINWPWRPWDIDLKPMRRSELVVIAGYTSLGKSSLMRQVCLGVAKAGMNTALASIEMPAGDIFGLMAGTIARVPCGTFKRAHKQDQDELLTAMKIAQKLEIDVLDNESSLAGIVAWARARHQRKFLDILVIDYLGIIADCQGSRYETKAAAVGKVAGVFKRLAGELGCVVVLGVQINRAADASDNRMPRLSDLKDSGDIEAHADRVILLHRPANDPSGGEQSLHDSVQERPRFFMQIFQEKGRNVGTASTAMWFRRELASFELSI